MQKKKGMFHHLDDSLEGDMEGAKHRQESRNRQIVQQQPKPQECGHNW